MARKPRIQYPGAMYHILSRGNYRKDLFTVARTGEQFEKAIFESKKEGVNPNGANLRG
ncbi:MAG: hypothetical protein O3C43_23740 [Verrucomicrobia bacterium]|nr:hypothetical protein [Verrucomicrobiota bacterium]